MNLEREDKTIKWYKEDGIKIRLKDDGEKAIVSTTLDGFNICLKLIMFDFLDRAKEDLLIDVVIGICWNNQKAFVVNSEDSMALVNYIPAFIKEWNIKISKDTVSNSDIIAEDVWYGLTE